MGKDGEHSILFSVMRTEIFPIGITRRELLCRSAVRVATLVTGVAFPGLASLAATAQGADSSGTEERLYAETLRTWCDGLKSFASIGTKLAAVGW